MAGGSEVPPGGRVSSGKLLLSGADRLGSRSVLGSVTVSPIFPVGDTCLMSCTLLPPGALTWVPQQAHQHSCFILHWGLGYLFAR